MCLLVGGENDCSSSKMSKKGFPYLVTPPTFDSLEKHVRKSYFVYSFLIFPLSYNASAYKDYNQNWCVIGHVKVQNCLFTYFLAILGQILPCWLPWQRTIFRDNGTKINCFR